MKTITKVEPLTKDDITKRNTAIKAANATIINRIKYIADKIVEIFNIKWRGKKYYINNDYIDVLLDSDDINEILIWAKGIYMENYTFEYKKHKDYNFESYGIPFEWLTTDFEEALSKGRAKYLIAEQKMNKEDNDLNAKKEKILAQLSKEERKILGL